MCRAIALYGSLRYGGPANGLMKGCTYLGQDSVYGRLYSLGSFPALRVGSEKDGERVTVDVYSFPAELENVLLSSLDKYEGCYPKEPDQSLYDRVKVLTVEGNLEVWVYEYLHQVNENRFVKSGDWFDEVQ
jgi:gamma-glutamylcyclotransferase (GGCT)/AIG2-like uncharacterized protein YtfP